MTKNKKISPEELDSLTGLAKLKLNNEERDAIANQLSEALDAVETLQTAKTEGVPIIENPTGLRNQTRKDEVKDSLTQKEALSNAKNTHNGYFVSEAILEHK